MYVRATGNFGGGVGCEASGLILCGKAEARLVGETLRDFERVAGVLSGRSVQAEKASGDKHFLSEDHLLSTERLPSWIALGVRGADICEPGEVADEMEG